MKYDVIIIGGGASGLFAGALLGEAGKSVLIFEPNRELGRKLRITGKGRCNLTNNCSPEEAMKNIPRNPKFLYSALAKFPPERIMAWYESHGLPLITERGRRVFPQSGRADDVSDILAKICRENGVRVKHSKVSEIIVKNGRAAGVLAEATEWFSDNVILAAGGLSYPRTGSDGGGYIIAEKLGHTVTKVRPSLVPIETFEDVSELAGLGLKNVMLSLYESGKKKPVYQELGEVTFMSYGISGPLGLTASCLMDSDKIACKAYKLVIDLKPALTDEQLDARLLRDIKSAPQDNVMNFLRGLMPSGLCGYAAKAVGIDKAASAGDLRREERIKLAGFLKRFELIPKALRPFSEAIVTRGGISVTEIDPASMESKLVNGLYFTGEIIDCDGFTGGYNLTIAFTTAYSAAKDIIEKEDKLWD